jgi:hypothetical protein
VAGYNSLSDKEVLQILAVCWGGYAVSYKIKIGSGELGQVMRFLSHGMMG